MRRLNESEVEAVYRAAETIELESKKNPYCNYYSCIYLELYSDFNKNLVAKYKKFYSPEMEEYVPEEFRIDRFWPEEIKREKMRRNNERRILMLLTFAEVCGPR